MVKPPESLETKSKAACVVGDAPAGVIIFSALVESIFWLATVGTPLFPPIKSPNLLAEEVATPRLNFAPEETDVDEARSLLAKRTATGWKPTLVMAWLPVVVAWLKDPA